MGSDRNRTLRDAFTDLLVLLVQVLIPIVLAAVLPLLPGLLLLLAAAVLTVVLVRMGRQKLASHTSRLLTGVIIGLSISLLIRAPAYWNLLIAPLFFMVGLGVQGTWDRHVGLMPDESVPKLPRNSGYGKLTKTPEGEPIRALNMGEIAMGGPVYCDYLLPDGVMLRGWGESALFSADGRYCAALLPSRQQWGLEILDRQERRLYRCKSPFFWELAYFSATDLTGSSRSAGPDEMVTIPLAELLAGATATDLVPVRDLWLPPICKEEMTTPSERRIPDPRAGEHRVTACRHVPDSLRELDRPLIWLRHPHYRLFVDGEPADVLIDDSAVLMWRADGKALCCRAAALRPTERDSGYWLWEEGAGWRRLPSPWVSAAGEPALDCYEPVALTRNAVQFDARLDIPSLSKGSHGVADGFVHGDREWLAGYTPEGCMQTGTIERTALRLELPLNGKKKRGVAAILSSPLITGARARLRWTGDGHGGLGRYDCHIGDWQLPDKCLLDHRVSADRRYLVLIPAPSGDSPPDHVVVVDVRRQKLIRSGPLLVTRLLDFRQDQLVLIEICGRLDDDTATGPLQYFQTPAPPPHEAAQFIAPKKGSRLYHRYRYLHLEGGRLLTGPDWRQVDQPQLAVAAGDFVYPSPDGKDAAWLFGATTECGDGWLREREARQGGYLLTASGCAIGDLAPSMIWSDDGRYLALTRRQHDDSGAPLPWQLLLLEPEAGKLYVLEEPVGLLPRLGHFDGKRLYFFVHQYGWSVAGDLGRPREITLATLLEQPCVELETHGDLKLAPNQMTNLSLWRALEKSPLHPWMTSARPVLTAAGRMS